jgi:TPR repeat protein
MLQRAAEAGDARASLLLGAAYNPIELEHFGVGGCLHECCRTARTWYEKAKQLGSVEAFQRLELLAKRDH